MCVPNLLDKIGSGPWVSYQSALESIHYISWQTLCSGHASQPLYLAFTSVVFPLYVLSPWGSVTGLLFFVLCTYSPGDGIHSTA